LREKERESAREGIGAPEKCKTVFKIRSNNDAIRMLRAFGTAATWRRLFDGASQSLWRWLYWHYLFSAAWQAKRHQAINRAVRTCEVCLVKEARQVHHKTYRRIGDEADGDLEATCPGCHKRKHGKLKSKEVTVTKHCIDDVATGEPKSRLRIAGRPRQGGRESYVLLEDPEEPVQMHYIEGTGKKLPHFRRDCPNCEGGGEPKPFWYIGGIPATGKADQRHVIVELTKECLQAALTAAQREFPVGHRDTTDIYSVADMEKPVLTGLIVEVIRADFPSSPRHLRSKGRAKITDDPAWPYRTREMLARIWEIPIRPRLYKEQA
jgi:hypothetical protein